MSYPPNLWFVRILQRILSGANSFIRRSVQRWLYLWSIFSRRFQSRRPSDDGNSKPIHYKFSQVGNVAICPSTQPRLSPNMHEMSNMSGLVTSPASRSSILQPTQDIGGRSAPDNISVSSRQSAISVAPPSITRRRNQGRSSLLRPYSYGGRSASRSSHDGRSASRSSHDLATSSRHNYSLNNFSTTSHHRPPSSPAASSTHSSDAGGYHISIEPESSLSNRSDISTDDFPNVAVPAGVVALPEIGEPIVLPGRLYQTTPEWILRYDRNVQIPMTDSMYNVQPLQTIFPHSDEPFPSGWTALTHPEGALYFYHDDRKIFTDAYLYDPDTLLHATAFIQRIDELKPSKSFPSDAELILEITPDEDNDGEIQCGYYFVHHQTRSLFWLEEFEVNGLVYEIQGLSSAAHLKHEIESQYWKHWELFPNTYDLSQDIITELSDTLLYASGDCLTSPVSTAPYSSDDLNKMLNLVNQVKPGKRHGHSACYVGRLMSTLTHQKFLHFHGQNGARLCRDQSLYKKNVPNKRSLLITVLSPILFSAPDVHLRALEDIWVDEIIGHVPWNAFMTKLSDDWKEFTLYGTVLLNANVAFLAIQSIDTNRPDRSAAQLSSYASVVVSVGSIILGLILDRQNRTKDRDSAQAASTFLSRMRHPTLGLESLAIMYSLPYALLMWGMLSFLTAFSFMCFDDTNIRTRLLVGATSVAICVLIFWSIWTAWESGEHYWWTLLLRIYEFCRGALQPKLPNSDPEMKLKRVWRLPGMFVRRSWESPASTVTVPV